MSTSKEITSKLAYKEYRRADMIIRYLTSPAEANVELSATEKKTLDYCKEIHTLRFNFHKKTDIVALMSKTHGITERQVYNLINETEEIFGKVEGVSKDYERNFLIERSRKNIEIAMQSRNSNNISKALMAHYKIVGLDEFVPEMPDFSKLEQHKYIINLPVNIIDAIKHVVATGAIKLSDVIPPPTPDTSGIQEAKEVQE
jgi:DNA-directed RNA polymerase beta' subunit